MRSYRSSFLRIEVHCFIQLLDNPKRLTTQNINARIKISKLTFSNMSFTNVCEALGGFFKLDDGLPI